MTDRKVVTRPGDARPQRAAARARLLRACNASGLTQDELGRLVGTDARGVRKLQRKDRKRVDRLELLVAIETRNAGGAVASGARKQETAAGLRAQPITPHTADEWAKTPGLGHHRIEASENAATETRPKLPLTLGARNRDEAGRVQVEGVTGTGETVRPLKRRAA